MRRDLELLRKIVIAIEDEPGGWAPQSLEFEGFTASQVGYHSYLLIDGGLAKGVDLTTFGSDGPEAQITQLTAAGHDFAANARNELFWGNAMKLVKSNGGAVALGVFIEILAAGARKSLGLP